MQPSCHSHCTMNQAAWKMAFWSSACSIQPVQHTCADSSRTCQAKKCSHCADGCRVGALAGRLVRQEAVGLNLMLAVTVRWTAVSRSWHCSYHGHVHHECQLRDVFVHNPDDNFTIASIASILSCLATHHLHISRLLSVFVCTSTSLMTYLSIASLRDDKD